MRCFDGIFDERPTGADCRRLGREDPIAEPDSEEAEVVLSRSIRFCDDINEETVAGVAQRKSSRVAARGGVESVR